MKSFKYRNFNVINLLLPLLFTGEFLALSFQNLLKVSGFYFAIFTIACFCGGKRVITGRAFKKINLLDLLWFSYFVLLTMSAGLFGYTSFLSFLTIFISQAMIPFLIGRFLDESHCNSIKINAHLNLLFILYLGILAYLYMRDSSIFLSDRFYPFVDRSVEGSGGDPTQFFLGYGLAVIFLSNYLIIRSQNENFKNHRISKILIAIVSIITLTFVGSRSSIASILIIIVANEYKLKNNLKNFFYFLCCIFVIWGFCINFFPKERINFFSEFLFLLDVGGNDITCASSAEGSFLYRLSGIYQSLNLFLDNPLIGVGVGNYGWFHCGVKGDFIYPHNIILQIISESGLIGLAVFSFCIYKTHRYGAEFIRSAEDNIHGDVRKLFLNFWIFCFLVAIFSGNAYGDTLFYLLSGIVSKRYHSTR